MNPSAIAIGAALAFGATSADAASVFDVFRGLCLDHGGDAAAVMEHAKAMGWARADSSMVRVLTAPSERGEVTTGAEGRSISDLRGTVAVIVARTNRMIPRQEIPAQACLVVAGPSIDAKAVHAEAASYAAVPGRLGLAFQKKAMGYLWNEVDGRREPLAAEDIVSARDAGGVKMLIVMELQDTSVLELFVPAKEQN